MIQDGRHEPEQAEHEQLALPEREQASRASRSSPVPCGLSWETTRYIGSIPKRVRSTIRRVAIRRERTGCDRRDGGYVAQGREIVNPSEAHDLPPRVLLLALAWPPDPSPPRYASRGASAGSGCLNIWLRSRRSATMKRSGSVAGADTACLGWTRPVHGQPRIIGIGHRGVGNSRLPLGQPRPSASATSSATSDGFVAALIPASLRASLLASAVLSPPETMAHAWPIVLPSGAVKPAM